MRILAYSILASIFISSCGDKLNIALVPVGDVNPNTLEIVRLGIKSYYKSKIRVEKPIMDINQFKTPIYGFDGELIDYGYNHLGLLEKLRSDYSIKYNILIGITDSAIYLPNIVEVSLEFEDSIENETTNNLKKENTIIRGVATGKGWPCLVSTYKIKMESQSDDEYKSILIKTVRHEIGHVFGLAHCNKTPKCLMQGTDDRSSNLIKDANGWLCDSCLLKIDYKLIKR